MHTINFFVLLIVFISVPVRPLSGDPLWTASPHFKAGHFTYALPTTNTGPLNDVVVVTHTNSLSVSQIPSRKVVLGILDILYNIRSQLDLTLRYKSSFNWGFDFYLQLPFQQDLFQLRISYMEADPLVVQPLVTNQFYKQYTPVQTGPFSLTQSIDIFALYSESLSTATPTTMTSQHIFYLSSASGCYQIKTSLSYSTNTELILTIETSCTLTLSKIGLSFVVFGTQISDLLNLYSASINYFATGQLDAYNDDYSALLHRFTAYNDSGFFMGLSAFKGIMIGNLYTQMQLGIIIYMISAMPFIQLRIDYWISVYGVCDSTIPFYRIADYKCYDICPSYTMTQTMTMQCLECHYSCYLCSSIANAAGCSSCSNSDNRQLVGTSCQPKVGYYESNSQVALPCSGMTGCLECSSIVYCTRCQIGYFVNSVNVCTLCSTIDIFCAKCSMVAGVFTCIACLSSAYTKRPSDGVCLPCNVFKANCLTCFSSTVCLTCASGYVVAAGSCNQVCGNGIVTGTEHCDDGNVVNGDGCSSVCSIQCGFYMPHCSTCSSSSSCTTCSSGYTLQTMTGSCITVCGDSILVGVQACDDGNIVDGDGCSSLCTIECAFYMPYCSTCSGTISCSTCVAGFAVQGGACASVCGDSLIVASETCDDGNVVNGDGCSSVCSIQCGFYMPHCSTCSSSSSCTTCSSGYTLQTMTGSCITVCGDSILVGAQACDDGNIVDGDGCSSLCTIECAFYMPYCSTCSGTISCSTCVAGFAVQGGACASVCGDRLIVGNEQCEDGNTINGDGCNSICLIQCNFYLSHCSACVNSTTCTSCQAGYNILGRFCELAESSNDNQLKLSEKVTQLLIAVIILGVLSSFLILIVAVACVWSHKKVKQRDLKTVGQSDVKINQETSFQRDESKINTVHNHESFIEGQTFYMQEPVETRARKRNKRKREQKKNKGILQDLSQIKFVQYPEMSNIENPDNLQKTQSIQITDNMKTVQKLEQTSNVNINSNGNYKGENEYNEYDKKDELVEEYFDLDLQEQIKPSKSQNLNDVQVAHNKQKNQLENLNQNIIEDRLEGVGTQNQIYGNSKVIFQRIQRLELHNDRQLKIEGQENGDKKVEEIENKIQNQGRKRRKNPKSHFKN